MKRRAIILLILAGALPFSALPATDASTPAPQQSFVVPVDLKLSKPARDVKKMTSSGVSDDVIKAFVDNSAAPFNLTADNIIQMQSAGVSSSVTSEMLNHDKKMSDQAAAIPPQVPPGQPAAPPYPYPAPAEPQQVVPQNTVSTYTIPADTGYYNDLAPYGGWFNEPGYGWCWQPYYGLGYAYYPWGILGAGCWFDFPGRGWCWFPGRRFGGRVFGGERFGDGRFGGERFRDGRFGGEHFGGTRFAASRGTFATSRFGGFRGGVSVTHIGGSGFHGGGFSHFSGGSHFGGGHVSGGSHFSGGGRSFGGHR